MKNRRTLLSFLLLLILPGVFGFAPLRQTGADISLSVSAGYNGYFDEGQWVPVRVTLDNTGNSDLSGEVRVHTGGGSGLADTTYNMPVDLPRGAHKEVFLYVSLGSYNQRLHVEVTDRKGHVVQRENADIRMTQRGDVLYAVIADPQSSVIIDMTGRTPGSGSGYQTYWQIEQLPDMAEALSGLDVILFYDTDTGKLTDTQRIALDNWVLTGGHLIVAGGASWQRTTAGLQNLLPVTLQGTAQVNSLAPLADYLGDSPDPLDVPTTISLNTPQPGAETLVTVGDIPLVVRRNYGEGVVDFLAVEPHVEPFLSWTQLDDLWYTLLASVGQQTSWSHGFTNWNLGREATLTVSNTVLPTFLQLCGFLLLYIILVGPLNYLILKKFNRREWAWLTIPLMILLFSVLAYRVGFNLRGNVATINRLTVVQVWPESDRAQVNSLIGVQSPRRATYNVELERGYSLRTLPDIGTGLNGPASIVQGTHYEAQDIAIDAGTIASFTASGYTNAPHVQAAVTWHMGDNENIPDDLPCDQFPCVAGEITNSTAMELEDTVLLAKGESRYLGTLKPGESRNFAISIGGTQDPGPLTIGNPLNQYNLYYVNPWQAPPRPGWCFSYDELEGIPLTVMDVMRNERFSCTVGSVNNRQQEIRRRYRLIGSLVSDLDLSGGRGTRVYLFGWNKNSLVNVDLGDKPQADEDTTLYVFELSTTVETHSEEVEVPPSITTWTNLDTGEANTLTDIAPIRFRVSSTNQAVFQFMPMPGMRLAWVSELTVKFRAQGPLTIEIWNWDTSDWEMITINPDDTDTIITNPGGLVGPENAVNIRVRTLDTTSSYNQIDFLKVGYRGQLAE